MRIEGNGTLRLESPYEFGVYRHKVQLHAHTTRSDGRVDPQPVMKAYEDLGYAAVAVTDHDYAGRTSLNLEHPGGTPMLHIPGVEYSADANNESWCHLLAVGITHVHHADGLDARQSQVDAAAAEQGLSFLCHPYGEEVHRRGWTAQEALGLRGYNGIEIYNGISSDRHEVLSAFSRAVDLVLASGRRITIISSDDSHQRADMDRGYLVINSSVPRKDLQVGDVLSALRSGDFYAVGRIDSGATRVPVFLDIEVAGDTITVRTDCAADIAFMTRHHHTAAPGPDASLLEEGVSCARYTASPDDGFVRVEATLRENGLTSRAWSNPIHVIPR